MSRTRLFWHVVVAPVAGAAGGAALYGAAVRPLLPWPGPVLDVLGVVCGAGGLLAGGVLSFLPQGRAETADGSGVAALSGRQWIPAGAVGSTVIAVASAVLLAGVPGVTWPVVVAGAVGGGAACSMASWLIRRRG